MKPDLKRIATAVTLAVPLVAGFCSLAFDRTIGGGLRLARLEHFEPSWLGVAFGVAVSWTLLTAPLIWGLYAIARWAVRTSPSTKGGSLGNPE